MCVFCDRPKLGSTAAIDCLTDQNKELLILLVSITESERA